MEAQLSNDDANVNRRRERRVKVLKAGRVIFNFGFSAMDCIVRNVSSSGAMIDIPSVIGLPDSFDLAIGGDPKARHARVMWRAEHLAGVCYAA